MTDHTHSDSDADLTRYLDGSDGLSAAYQRLGQDTPPSVLDARILAAARGALHSAAPAPLPARRAPRHALAATFVVCTLSAMLYFSQHATDAAFFTRAAREAPPATLGAAAAEFSSANAAAPVAAPPPSASLPQQSLPQQSLPQQPLPQRPLLQQAPATTPAPASAPLRNTAVAPTVNEAQPSAAPLASSTAANDARAGSALAAPDPHDSREHWVNYLRDLQHTIDTDADSSARDALQAQLAREKIDFASAYPDADLEALLAAP
jgi:hypothetical protein